MDELNGIRKGVSGAKIEQKISFWFSQGTHGNIHFYCKRSRLNGIVHSLSFVNRFDFEGNSRIPLTFR